MRAVSPRGGDRRRHAEEEVHRRDLPWRTRVRRAVAPPSQDDCRSGTASVHPRRGVRHRLPCLRRARARRRDLCHQSTSPPRSGRYRPVNEHMARLGLQRQAEAEIALEFGSDLGAISDGSPVVRDEHGSFVQGHAARSTLITQLSRSLVLITALGTTGILIPKALNAARMRAAWIASIHAIPASSSIMYGDFNFAASLTYPTAAPISSASASLAMLTSLSTLP